VQKINDNTTWVAIACVLGGWFGMSTLVATFGPLQHAVRFYELPAAIKDPRWLLSGVGPAPSLSSIVFGIVCLIVIAAPLLPRLGYSYSRAHIRWLTSSAPLLLMLLCGITLYVKSSSVHIEAESMGRLGGYVARWANGAIGWTGDVVARHIAVGAGGYLSFIASGFLAVKGITDRRRPVH
jgi:hypothetical protein